MPSAQRTPLPPPDASLSAIANLAGPILVANMAIMGSGTIDTIMAGRLGAEHLAAIALGIAATTSVMMGLVGIVQGLSPIAGHYYGAREYPKIGEALHQSLWLGLALLMIGVPVLLQTDFWTGLGGLEENVARMARAYMFWSALALPACMGARIFISVNAAVSRPRVTMWVSLGMLVMKVPLNMVFMHGLLGFPAMGGAGAGLSFCLLNYGALLTYALIWSKGRFYRKMHAPRFTPPRWLLLKEHLRVGVPIGLSTFFEVSSFTLMAIFVSRLGAETISAHQIVANLSSIFYMVPLSIGIASTVLISQSLGARWPAMAYDALRRVLKAAVAIALFSSIFLAGARSSLIWLYTKEAAVHDLAVSLILFGCFYHVFDALQSVSAFLLRGYRVTKAPMIIYGVMLWGVGLGGGYYFAFHGEPFGGPWGVYGFWGATALGLFLTGITLAAMALWVGRHRALEETHSPEEVERAAARNRCGLF